MRPASSYVLYIAGIGRAIAMARWNSHQAPVARGGAGHGHASVDAAMLNADRPSMHMVSGCMQGRTMRMIEAVNRCRYRWHRQL
jgi:hypothetical protein